MPDNTLYSYRPSFSYKPPAERGKVTYKPDGYCDNCTYGDLISKGRRQETRVCPGVCHGRDERRGRRW